KKFYHSSINPQLLQLVPQRPERDPQRRGGLGLVVAVLAQGVLDGGALDLLDVRGQGAGRSVARVQGAWVDALGGRGGVRMRGGTGGGRVRLAARGGRERRRRRRGSARDRGIVLREAQVGGTQHVAIGQGHGALEDVLQLAHVARERVVAQGVDGLVREDRRGAAQLAGQALEDRLRQAGKVAGALAQRRHAQLDDGDAVGQVVAEAALADQLRQG